MESIPDLNYVIEQLQYQQSGYWLAAGGAVLFFYDWLLCLDREVQYVRKSRWSFGKVWFICHRYAMMVLVIGMLYGSVKSSNEPSSPEWCKRSNDIINVANIAIIAAIQGTFVLRVCALYRNSSSIIAFLGATYISCHVFTLVFYTKLNNAMQYLPNTLTLYHVCARTCDDCIRWSIYLYIPLMVLDVMILLLTIRKSFVAGPQRSAAPILVTLFRDGILYFAVAFATALVNILFNVFGPGAVKTWMVSYTGPLASSMATRLILNLHDQVSRTAHYPTDSPTTVCEGHTNAFSTVEFAVPAVTRDVESTSHDMYGGESSTDVRTRTGDRDDEGNAFELRALREDGKEESTPSTEWLESEGTLTVPGRRLRGAAKVDPG